ncbi:MAG: ribonuclease R [Bacteroidales bacterium]
MTKKSKKDKPEASSRRFRRKELKLAVLEVFNQAPNQNFNYKQVSRVFEITDDGGREMIVKILDELREEGRLEEVHTGKYRFRVKAGFVEGVIEMTTSHNAFVHAEGLAEPVFIARDNLNHALPGDKVKVSLLAKRKKRHLEGEVIDVLERARNSFVGIVELSGAFGFLVPDSKEIPYDLFIPADKLNGVQHGQKAIARMIDWPAKARNPLGEIVEVLGYPGQHEAEMHAILAEYDLPWKFSEEIEKAAGEISDLITEEEIAQRRDFRKIITFTIDPHDAKDFDDALSLQRLPNGHWEVGVHIADVTHYVKPGTLLDQEALERATSVYLVDRVVPMLPERLSNFLCSLRPDEDKLCFSAVFEMNDRAEIINDWFGKTIIRSARRFNYDEAQEIIDTGKGDFAAEMLTLHKLADILRNERFKKGSFNFEKSEVKFEIDPEGKPLRVYFKTYKQSNELVEEFMLLANKRVAEWVNLKPDKKGKMKERTFVYRIHDKPDQEKLQGFAVFIKKLGYSINMSSGKKISESMNQLMHQVKGKKEENILENLAVRVMAKAEYSTENIGHYGLAFPYYSHFTSPIRRYPDMLAHRLLFRYLKGNESAGKREFELMCKHSSEMEKRAAEAERASIKFKQVEFMSDKIGKVFDAVISGVTEWGLYAQILENGCEGLIHIRELVDDFYWFDEDNYRLLGRKYKKAFQLGDELKVQILRTNLVKKQLDMKLWDPEGAAVEKVSPVPPATRKKHR